MAKKLLPSNNPRRAVALVRVSKEEQELSPEAQAHSIEQYCQAQGLELVAVFIERITSVAPLLERTGLQAALQALRPLDAGLLVFLNRDRISRDVVLTKTIEREAARNGAKVQTTAGMNGDSPHDEMLRTIMDAVAQHEREHMIVKTKDALAAKKRRGEHVGGLPYGLKWVDGSMVPNPAEQQVIAKVQAQYLAGASIAHIVRTLDATCRRGTRFSKTQIIRMLHSTRNDQGQGPSTGSP